MSQEQPSSRTTKHDVSPNLRGVRNSVPVAPAQAEVAIADPVQDLIGGVLGSVGKWRKAGEESGQQNENINHRRERKELLQRWSSPSQHGVEQNPQAPDVTPLVIALTLQHLKTPNTTFISVRADLGPEGLRGSHNANLRSDEVSGVARRHQQAVVSTQLLSKSKVTDPDGLWISRIIDIEDVAWLQVSVHHLGVRKEE